MAPETGHVPLHGADWADALSRDALQLIAEGVTEMVGFQVAVLSVVRDDILRSVAIAGSESAHEQLNDASIPMDVIRQDLAIADDWGRFQFVPGERSLEETTEWAWVPEIEASDDPDAWQALDLLVAPLRDAAGEIVGLLSIDLPVNGRRPDADQRTLLERYAAQAERAVLVALERQALSEQIRLATAAREIVRNASVQLHIDDLLQQCGEALTHGFRAGGSWVQTFDEEVVGSGALHSAQGADIVLPDPLVEMAEAAAHQLWSVQQSVVLEREPTSLGVLTQEQYDQITAFMERIGADYLLFVPLGAGATCVGNMVLTRVEGQPPWNATEADAALDIGHDLGRAILNARTFAQEHRLVAELTALDVYKGQLIATVSHELKNPLTAIVGHLELLEGAPELSPVSRSSLGAIGRGTRRLQRVIDDLLLLSKVGDPDNPIIPAPVHLQPLVEDVRDLIDVVARRARVRVETEVPDAPVRADGDAEEIHRLLTNLISNAVKYSPPDTTVTMSVGCEDDTVVLTCRDQGIGISPQDQEQLFSEFFRSADPDARAQPGTGLGLAIVARIVERHRGTISVVSTLGRGSTFTVRLPASRTA